MFQNAQAGPALDLYSQVVPGFDVTFRRDYGPDGDGPEGSVEMAHAQIGTHRLIVLDSPITHDFGFTPSVSLFLTFKQAAQLDACFAGLLDGGEVMMPIDDYGFSPRFGWLTDRFGVSWQLSL